MGGNEESRHNSSSLGSYEDGFRCEERRVVRSDDFLSFVHSERGSERDFSSKSKGSSGDGPPTEAEDDAFAGLS